jgi:pterin-4a-carbinolamine dehydratase
VGWGYCEVELTIHAAGGLTGNDFIMAAKVERAAAAALGGGRPEG